MYFADNAVDAHGNGLQIVHGDWEVHMGTEQVQCTVSPVASLLYDVKAVKPSQRLSQV